MEGKTIKALLRLLRTFLANRPAILVFRLILSGTFLLSSFGKLVDIKQYSVNVVLDYDILPIAMARVFGYALPFIELGCALAILTGLLTRLSSLGIAVLSLSFFTVKAYLLLNGIDIHCGCVGAVATTFASFTIFLDPIIFLMALAVLFSPQESRNWISLGNRLPQTWQDRLKLIR